MVDIDEALLGLPISTNSSRSAASRLSLVIATSNLVNWPFM